MTERSSADASGADDFDAYRRNRNTHDDTVTVLEGFDSLATTEDPALALTRAIDLFVPALWHGGEVEIAVAEQPIRRHRASASADVTAATAVMHVPFSLSTLGEAPNGAALLSVWWTDRDPLERDRIAAALVMRAVTNTVLVEQFSVSITEARDQAAVLAVDAITVRRVNLAVGILMERHQLSEHDAELRLRRDAVANGRSVPDEAFHIRAARPIPGRGPTAGQRPPGPQRFHRA